nr:hypothetical protein [Desulfosarcina cetonica]
MRRRHAALQPFDTVDKADLQLVHDQFDGVEVPSARKASGKIVTGIDGCVRSTAYGADKSLAAVLDGSTEQVFYDPTNGDPVA